MADAIQKGPRIRIRNEANKPLQILLRRAGKGKRPRRYAESWAFSVPLEKGKPMALAGGTVLRQSRALSLGRA